MKQSLFMVLVLALATFGAASSPFWPVLLYYFFAVLRPQVVWDWALPEGVRWSAVAAAIVLFGLLAHPARIWRRLDLNVITVLIVLYAFWVGAGLLSAYDPIASRDFANIYFKVALMCIIAIYAIETVGHIRLLGLVVVLSLGYLAYNENYKYLVQNRLDIFHVGYGDLDNNGAALLIVAALPLACMFAFTAGRGIWRFVRWLSVPICAFIVHAVLLSYSRGAMVAGIVGVVWVVMHHRPRRQIAVAAVAMCVLVNVLAGQEVRERFMTTTEYHEDSTAMRRLSSWQAAWAMAWDRPIFGYGLRNSPQYIAQYSDDGVAPTVHNQYLQIAADSGIPALALYALLLGAVMLRLRYSRRLCQQALDENPLGARRDRLTEARNLWLGFEGCMVTIMAGAMFLSIEVMELPWLLYAVAAVSPRIAEALVSSSTHDSDADDEPGTTQTLSEPVERRAAA